MNISMNYGYVSIDVYDGTDDQYTELVAEAARSIVSLQR